MDSEAFRLTDAELAVLREHLGPVFSSPLGDSEADTAHLVPEGLRSLAARNLCRIDSHGVALSSKLVEVATALLAPPAAVTMTKLSGEAASVVFAVADDGSYIAHRPVIAGVHEFRYVNLSQLVEALVVGVMSEDADRPAVWQFRMVSGEDVDLLAVGVGEDGAMSLLDAEGQIEGVLDSAGLTEAIEGLLHVENQ
jgi:hypothetical protein